MSAPSGTVANPPPALRVRFWGTRGSLARPGAATLRYGGNTSCTEVTTAAGTLVILDGGTGIHDLGVALMAGQPRPLRGSIFISHTHWDHIQGLPFFTPLRVPGNEWDIYGPRRLVRTLREILAGQMQPAYFPVSLNQLGANIRYHDLVEGTFQVEEIGVTARYLHHPALTLGFRLQAGGATFVYACDHEPCARDLAAGPAAIDPRDQRHVEFLAGADLVSHDAQYTEAEYPARRGWGHSPMEYAVEVCVAAGVRKLALTHHDPQRGDEALDHLVDTLRARLAEQGTALELVAAAEGQEIEVHASTVAAPTLPEAVPVLSALVDQYVLLGVAAPDLMRALEEAARAENLACVAFADGAAALRMARARPPSLILLEQSPAFDGLRVARLMRDTMHGGAAEFPLILVAGQEDREAGLASGVTAWLLTPFSHLFARTQMRAWIWQTPCRWLRAPVPANEAKRLASLRQLRILDTVPEERFDRVTRIAAGLADVSTALISLVDENRQWFKSCFGLPMSGSGRDMAFCSHVVASGQVMLIPDTLDDVRFAENPLVTGEPYVRFYVGFPLLVEGGCIGTLCLIDDRPRLLPESKLTLLQDLAALVGQELHREAQPGRE